METLKDILNAAEQSIEACSDQNKLYRELNELITANILKVEIAPYGKYLLTANDLKYSIKITAGGYIFRYTQTNRFSLINLQDVAKTAAKALTNPTIKAAVKANNSEPETCYKCHGRGIINQYLHVCEGVCFNCAGVGFKLKK